MKYLCYISNIEIKNKRISLLLLKFLAPALYTLIFEHKLRFIHSILILNARKCIIVAKCIQYKLYLNIENDILTLLGL